MSKRNGMGKKWNLQTTHQIYFHRDNSSPFFPLYVDTEALECSCPTFLPRRLLWSRKRMEGVLSGKPRDLEAHTWIINLWGENQNQTWLRKDGILCPFPHSFFPFSSWWGSVRPLCSYVTRGGHDHWGNRVVDELHLSIVRVWLCLHTFQPGMVVLSLKWTYVGLFGFYHRPFATRCLISSV